ncbi:hypothetical protein BDV39DRAFT_75271 [Aspergillus sergii]|uniref:Uncharacterized protein n=1 Tax=Aspergillus sergii TaxID=1034303 RepID=A0A5N6XLB3_9EURO|nr:hypothetical protein BDV39DRAFT_75271 [Aspergillus sergii]
MELCPAKLLTIVTMLPPFGNFEKIRCPSSYSAGCLRTQGSRRRKECLFRSSDTRPRASRAPLVHLCCHLTGAVDPTYSTRTQ